MRLKADTSIERIGKGEALALLDTMVECQRNLRQTHVARLAADMNAGRFRLGPDAILIVKGRLANGQHRLRAIVESGKPQQFIVLRSNDEDLYKVVDSGVKRTVADGLHGGPYRPAISAAARWVIGYDREAIGASFTSGTGALNRLNGRRVAVTQSEMIDYCLANRQELVRSVSITEPLYKHGKCMPLSIGTALHFIAARRGHDSKAKSFLEVVYQGDRNSRSPSQLLHLRLTSDKGSKYKLPAGYVFGLGIRALCAEIKGEELRTLKWVKDSKLPRIEEL